MCGMPIALVTVGILAMAFMGFHGLVNNEFRILILGVYNQFFMPLLPVFFSCQLKSDIQDI